MKWKIISAFVLFIYCINFTIAQSKGDMVFNSEFLHEIRFYSDSEPNLYETLGDESMTSTRPYHMVSMEFDGVEIDSIGIRAKGGTSVFSDQVPLKIDINEFVNQQEFDGLKKLNLNNSYEDGYRQRDRVAYELFRRAGVPAPRTSYAAVYVNDVFTDIYLLAQQIDKTFVNEHFSDEGSLFRVDELIYGEDVLNNLTGAMGVERLDKLDTRRYFKFLLINSIAEAFDNFPVNNYYISYSEKEDLFNYVPWDYNFTFDFQPGTALSIHPFADYDIIWDIPSNRALYLEVACELNEYLLDETFIDDLLQSNENIILSNTEGATVEDYLTLRNFLIERKLWLENQLMTEGANCQSLSYPLSIGDLVINEFVAKSDSVGGVQEPDGGTPDWIELYNNTSEDIEINHHYYLSDDVDFPKKWNFKSEVIIPANGYQIIWADRDVHQEGIHANFKIEKSGGDLLLVYEDQTVIDYVSYEDQSLNQGFARVPNGTGSFVIQDHTFNANNDEALSILSHDWVGNFEIFPNPTNDVINIKTSQIIESIAIQSVEGAIVETANLRNDAIDVKQLISGIYFLHIRTYNENHVIRFIKL